MDWICASIKWPISATSLASSFRSQFCSRPALLRTLHMPVPAPLKAKLSMQLGQPMHMTLLSACRMVTTLLLVNVECAFPGASASACPLLEHS